MLVTKLEDLEVWKLGREIVKDVYNDFKTCNDFAFKNQITRASISIMNNLSEEFSRESKREFHQFLNISKGSNGEVKTCIISQKTKITSQQNWQQKEEKTMKKRKTCLLN